VKLKGSLSPLPSAFKNLNNNPRPNLFLSSAGLVSEPTRQVPEAGEAAAKGPGTVCDPILQRDDEEHPGLQRLAGLPAVSAPQHHEPLSPGEILYLSILLQHIL